MADVWVGRFNRWIEKFLSVKGGPVLVDMEPSVRVNLPIQSGNEDRYLQGWNRFGVNVPVAAVAALNGIARIRNPAGSNVIAVIETVLYFNATAAGDLAFATWGATVTDLTTIVATTFARIDPRGNPQPTCIISSQAAAAGANFMQFSVPVNNTVNFVQSLNTEFQLLPGQIWQVQSNNANQLVVASFLWRERSMEPSELT